MYQCTRTPISNEFNRNENRLSSIKMSHTWLTSVKDATCGHVL